VSVHDIEIELPPKVVLHKDVTFVVKSDSVKLGELRVSKGSIDWVPAKHQNGCRLRWEQFDLLMREHGSRV
jgi:hypothetical protein